MMDTHALNVFSQQQINPLIKMPPQPVGPPRVRPPVEPVGPPDMKGNSGVYHPIAVLSSEIHKIVLDLVLRWHNRGIIHVGPPREQFGGGGEFGPV